MKRLFKIIMEAGILGSLIALLVIILLVAYYKEVCLQYDFAVPIEIALILVFILYQVRKVVRFK